MANRAFREDQHAHSRDPHIAPINVMVGALRGHDGRGWMPEVAPLHGGIDAQVLSILRDPGPGTQADSGSGFLCVENDDPTAQTQCELFEEYGIPLRTVLPWNAYPWYINSKPKAAQLERGAEVLEQLIALVPTLKVVLLQGNDAEDAWKRLMKRPTFHLNDGIRVVKSIHPGRQALWTPDETVREAREKLQRDAFEQVAHALQH